jgi:hypothetical protein
VKLKIAERLSLPLDWMSLATVVYGARGSGKTTFGSVCAEEVTKAKQRFCAIDLKGDWYGLKSTADGKGEGLPVVVFGGDHKDLPLEEGAGTFIGETIAALDQSAIIDLEQFSKGKQVKFLKDFFLALYHHNREPLLLLADEAQRYAPQATRGTGGEILECLGAVEDVVKLGRKHGLGVVLFTQRGSGLNKEVSELCDMLVAFRTPGPLDQERVENWLDANATAEQATQVMSTIASLATGTAIIASGHPDLKVFGTYQIRRRETFDSSATPKVGQRRLEPKRLAKPDLDLIRSKMSDAIERQKAEDPRELRKQIAELKRAAEQEKLLASKKNVLADKPVKRVEVLTDADRELLTRVLLQMSNVSAGLANRPGDIFIAFEDRLRALMVKAVDEEAEESVQQRAAFLRTIEAKGFQKMLAKLDAIQHQPGHIESTLNPHRIPPVNPREDLSRRVAPPVATRRPAAQVESNGNVGNSGLRRMLIALAQRPQGLTRARVGLRAGLSSKTGTFAIYLGKMRSHGWVEDSGSTIRITAEGLAALGPFDPLPEGADLAAFWMRELGGGAGRMLSAIVAAHPRVLSREELGEASGLSEKTGTFATYLGKLRGLELVDGLQASDELFG